MFMDGGSDRTCVFRMRRRFPMIGNGSSDRRASIDATRCVDVSLFANTAEPEGQRSEVGGQDSGDSTLFSRDSLEERFAAGQRSEVGGKPRFERFGSQRWMVIHNFSSSTISVTAWLT